MTGNSNYISEQDNGNHVYPEDVQIISLDGREIFLVGTAHVSQESVDLVQQVIAREKPDCVCVNLITRDTKLCQVESAGNLLT